MSYRHWGSHTVHCEGSMNESVTGEGLLGAGSAGLVPFSVPYLMFGPTAFLPVVDIRTSKQVFSQTNGLISTGTFLLTSKVRLVNVGCLSVVSREAIRLHRNDTIK